MKNCTLFALILFSLMTLGLFGQVTPPVLSVGDSLHVEMTKSDSLFFSADSVKFDYDRQLIKLFSNAEIKYHNYQIQADTILVDLKTRRAYTRGSTDMKDDNELMIGENTFYDVKTEQGLLFDGSGRFDRGYYYGDEIRRIDKKTYDIDNGRFTSCDDLHPHFYVRSEKLRIYINERIMGKPLVLYVNDFPLLWMPYGSFPAKRGRHAGFLVPEPGFNNSEGKYIKNLAYYIPYKDYADYLLSFDLTELKGWNVSFNNDYVKRYSFRGNIDFLYNHQIRSITNATDNWSLLANHSQDFGNKTTLKVNINYVTSKELWQGDENIDKRLSERITSSISFSKPLLSSNLGITANYTDNFVTDQKTVTLPKLTYSLPSKPIYEYFTSKESTVNRDAWWTNFSLRSSFTAVHTGKVYEKNPEFSDLIWDNSKDTLGVYINEHHAGAKIAESVYYTDKYLGWLVFSQSFSYNEYWFDRSKVSANVGRAGDYSTNTSLSTVIYGFKDFNTTYLKAMRHILKPSMSFSYKPDFSKHAGDYYTFDPVQPYTGKRSRTVNLALGQEWQVKVFDRKTEKDEVINNLLSMNSKCSYSWEKDKRRFSDLNHSVNFNPKQFKVLTANFKYSNSVGFSQTPYEMSWFDWDAKNWQFSQALTLGGNSKTLDYFQNETNPLAATQIKPPSSEQPITIEELEKLTSTDSWNLSLNHNMNSGRQFFKPRSSSMRLSASVNLTNKWKVSYNNYYDLQDKRMVSQSLFLTRDLHCWKLTISYNRSNEYWDYRLIFFNVNFERDIKLETSGNKKY